MELDILTVDEAAQALRVEPEIVIHLLEASEIPGRLIEGSWRTTRRALASFVDGVPLQASCCSPYSCGPMCCPPGLGPGSGKDGSCC